MKILYKQLSSINMYTFSIISIPIICQNPTKTKPWNTHFQFCDMSKSAGMIVSWYSGREYPCLRIASTTQQLQLLYKPRLLMLALIYSSMFIRLLLSLSRPITLWQHGEPRLPRHFCHFTLSSALKSALICLVALYRECQTVECVRHRSLCETDQCSPQWLGKLCKLIFGQNMAGSEAHIQHVHKT